MARSLKGDPLRENISDKLDLCLRSFLVLWGITLGLGFLVCVSSLSLHRSIPDVALDLVETLDLTVLSLVPSGQVLRNPEIVHPGVDMRMVPYLPPIRVDSSSLLLDVE